MDQYRIIKAFGVEVIPSTHIDAPAIIVGGQPVVLIRADLTPDEHETTVHDLLAELPDLVRSSRAL